ncbi:MAG TPA: phage holin family protein [Burkholderiales bacterium]|nr:phage holin family protein [Burkholderiales bacterium]
MPTEAGAPRPPGLFDSLARLGRTALALARTRVEILATELEEERIRVAQLALVVAGIAFCVQMAVLLAVALIVVLLWDTHRLITLGAAVAFFLIAGIAATAWLRHRLRTRPKMFASTIGELLKDEERLK